MTDIISPLPFTLSNGSTGDASQVQANFDQIRNDVNNNYAEGNIGNVKGPIGAIDGHLAVFDGTSGALLRDGGALLADVQGPGSSITGHLAVFADTSGKVIADGGAVPLGAGYRGAFVRNSANIPFTYTGSAVSFLIPFNTAIVDTDGIVASTTNLVVPSGISLIRMSAAVLLDTAGHPGGIDLSFVKNGTAIVRQTVGDTGSVAAADIGLSLSTTTLLVSPGDVLQAVIAFSGLPNGTYDVVAGSQFEMLLIG